MMLMKKWILSGLLMLPVWVMAQHKAIPFSTDTIAIAEAHEHYNAYKTICGTIKNITSTPTSIETAHIITVAEAKSVMTLVVWASDAGKWDPPLQQWLQPGSAVCVQAQITRYGGQPRMEIGSQGQIHVGE